MILFHQGRRLFCDVLGSEDAAAVCFVHSLAADSDMWSEQIPALLAAGYRVVRVDLRGHGASDAGEGDYSIDGLADDVLVILDALSIESAHVVGLSIGGMIAQSIAIRHSNRVITAVLCDTLAGIPAVRHPTFKSRIEEVGKIGTLVPIRDPGLSVRFTDAFREARPARYQQMVRNYDSTSLHGYLACMKALISFDFHEQLASVALPVLVIAGSEDPSAPPDVGREIAGLVQQGSFQEILKTRHLPNVERPEEFNRILLDWLERYRPQQQELI